METGKITRAHVCILAIMLLCLCTTVTVSAKTVAKGTCGERSDYGNIIWTLDDKGVLTIAPDDTEDLDRRTGSVVECPWDKTLVKEVIVKPGVYSIGNMDYSDHIFSNHNNLRKVTLPKGFSYLGNKAAFNGLTNLTEISAPDGFVLELPDTYFNYYYGAFQECKSLRSVPTLGGSQIYEQSFYYCSSLDHVVIAKGVGAIGTNAFRGCASLSDLTLPDTVTSIGRGAFSDCSSLSALSLPSALKEIGWEAFSGCNLKNVDIPKGVTTIQSYGFSYNKNLKTVTIPNSVTSIGECAFKDCALKEVKLSKNISSIGGTDYGDGVITFAFDKDVVIDAPAGSYAAKWAKENGFTLKGEKKADESSKSSDDKTKKVIKKAAGTFTISGKQATFTAPANKKATSLSIPSKVNGVKVTAIAPSACAKMKKLKKVTIPSGVKTIGKKAFYGCKNLKNIVIKTKKLTSKSVGSKAFGSIYKKAVIKCPKSKKASYKKILLKKGLKKTVKFK